MGSPEAGPDPFDDDPEDIDNESQDTTESYADDDAPSVKHDVEIHEESLRNGSTIPHSKSGNNSNATTHHQMSSNNAGSATLPLSEDSLPRVVAALDSSELSAQLQAAARLRRLLSADDPPIKEAVGRGAVPRLVELLRRDSSPRLQLEAAWALTNIASGAPEHVRAVVDGGALVPLCRLLRAADSAVREQAAWALGNIAGDGAKMRDKVLVSGALGPLVRTLRDAGTAALQQAKEGHHQDDHDDSHELDNSSGGGNNSGGTLPLAALRTCVWALSNLVRGKPAPPLQKVASALPVLAELTRVDDEEVLTDVCWALSYLGERSEGVDAVIETGVCSRLAGLLAASSASVQKSALHAVGNIVAGSQVQAQAALDGGSLPLLTELLSSPDAEVQRLAAWAISNVTAGSSDQIQAVMDHDAVGPLLSLLRSPSRAVRKEAAFAIVNVTTSPWPQHTLRLVDQGVIEPLCELLSSLEPVDIVTVTLEGLQNVLRIGETSPDHSESSTSLSNPKKLSVRELVEISGKDRMIDLCEQHKSGAIHNISMSILQRYFNIGNKPVEITNNEQEIKLSTSDCQEQNESESLSTKENEKGDASSTKKVLSPLPQQASAQTGKSKGRKAKQPSEEVQNNELSSKVGKGSTEPSNVSNVPSTSSSSTTTTSSTPNGQRVEFVVNIKNFTARRNRGHPAGQYSEVFDGKKAGRWRLLSYTHGTVAGKEGEWLSLYVSSADVDELACKYRWSRTVDYSITLVHPSVATGSISGKKANKTNSSQQADLPNESVSLSVTRRHTSVVFRGVHNDYEWGCRDFLPSDQVAEQGFLLNDSLLVKVEVELRDDSAGQPLSVLTPPELRSHLAWAAENGLPKACLSCLTTFAANNGAHAPELPSAASAVAPSSNSSTKNNKANQVALSQLSAYASALVSATCSEEWGTPLHLACIGWRPGNARVVSLLLDYGAPVDALNKHGETPLVLAAREGGQTAVVSTLLDRGGNPCLCSKGGWSPMSAAASRGRDDVVKLLATRGAPLEEVWPPLSALLEAAKAGHSSTALTLLESGADPEVQDEKGNTALWILLEKNMTDAALTMVQRHHASVAQCSRERSKVQRAKLLLKHAQRRVGKNPTSASATPIASHDLSRPSGGGNTTCSDQIVSSSNSGSDNSQRDIIHRQLMQKDDVGENVDLEEYMAEVKLENDAIITSNASTSSSGSNHDNLSDHQGGGNDLSSLNNERLTSSSSSSFLTSSEVAALDLVKELEEEENNKASKSSKNKKKKEKAKLKKQQLSEKEQQKKSNLENEKKLKEEIKKKEDEARKQKEKKEFEEKERVRREAAQLEWQQAKMDSSSSSSSSASYSSHSTSSSTASSSSSASDDNTDRKKQPQRSSKNDTQQPSEPLRASAARSKKRRNTPGDTEEASASTARQNKSLPTTSPLAPSSVPFSMAKINEVCIPNSGQDTLGTVMNISEVSKIPTIVKRASTTATQTKTPAKSSPWSKPIHPTSSPAFPPASLTSTSATSASSSSSSTESSLVAGSATGSKTVVSPSNIARSSIGLNLNASPFPAPAIPSTNKSKSAGTGGIHVRSRSGSKSMESLNDFVPSSSPTTSSLATNTAPLLPPHPSSNVPSDNVSPFGPMPTNSTLGGASWGLHPVSNSVISDADHKPSSSILKSLSSIGNDINNVDGSVNDASSKSLTSTQGAPPIGTLEIGGQIKNEKESQINVQESLASLGQLGTLLKKHINESSSLLSHILPILLSHCNRLDYAAFLMMSELELINLGLNRESVSKLLEIQEEEVLSGVGMSFMGDDNDVGGMDFLLGDDDNTSPASTLNLSSSSSLLSSQPSSSSGLLASTPIDCQSIPEPPLVTILRHEVVKGMVAEMKIVEDNLLQSTLSSSLDKSVSAPSSLASNDQASSPIDNDDIPPGFVFVCSADTADEALAAGVFGLPGSHADDLNDAIEENTPIFLFNFSDGTLSGAWVADGRPAMNILPSAFSSPNRPTSRFPAQLRVKKPIKFESVKENDDVSRFNNRVDVDGQENKFGYINHNDQFQSYPHIVLQLDHENLSFTSKLAGHWSWFGVPGKISIEHTKAILDKMYDRSPSSLLSHSSSPQIHHKCHIASSLLSSWSLSPENHNQFEQVENNKLMKDHDFIIPSFNNDNLALEFISNEFQQFISFFNLSNENTIMIEKASEQILTICKKSFKQFISIKNKIYLLSDQYKDDVIISNSFKNNSEENNEDNLEICWRIRNVNSLIATNNVNHQNTQNKMFTQFQIWPFDNICVNSDERNETILNDIPKEFVLSTSKQVFKSLTKVYLEQGYDHLMLNRCLFEMMLNYETFSLSSSNGSSSLEENHEDSELVQVIKHYFEDSKPCLISPITYYTHYEGNDIQNEDHRLHDDMLDAKLMTKSSFVDPFMTSSLSPFKFGSFFNSIDKSFGSNGGFYQLFNFNHEDIFEFGGSFILQIPKSFNLFTNTNPLNPTCKYSSMHHIVSILSKAFTTASSSSTPLSFVVVMNMIHSKAIEPSLELDAVLQPWLRKQFIVAQPLKKVSSHHHQQRRLSGNNRQETKSGQYAPKMIATHRAVVILQNDSGVRKWVASDEAMLSIERILRHEESMSSASISQTSGGKSFSWAKVVKAGK